MKRKAKRLNFACGDCGMNTVNEYYMVHNHVWEAAGKPKAWKPTQPASEYDGGGFLCIGCLEQRLGRQLTPADFTECLINKPNPSDTERLANRKTLQ